MVDRKELNDRWQEKWKEGRTRWHVNDVNPHLNEYFHRLDDGDLKGKRILVPLCGKSVDLKWLYEKGMSVVGVEVAELPIKAFFAEHNFDYQIVNSEVLPDCQIFRHNERLSICLCDIFRLNAASIGGHCDYLWDRGALVAMVYEEQKKYWDLISSLLSTNARGLIECFEYDRDIHPGPPHSINKEQLAETLGNEYEAEQLCYRYPDELPEGYTSSLTFKNARVIYYVKRKV